MIKRRIILVNRSLQFRYAGLTIGTMAFAVALVIANTWLYILRNKDILSAAPGSEAAVLGLAKYLTIILLIFLAFVVSFSIFASHKIAGPIYRFTRVLEAVMHGDLTVRAFLRRGDELVELQNTLNQTLASLHSRIRYDKEKVLAALNLLQQARDHAVNSLSQEQSKPIVDKINAAESNLYDVGNKFKV